MKKRHIYRREGVLTRGYGNEDDIYDKYEENTPLKIFLLFKISCSGRDIKVKIHIFLVCTDKYEP